MIKTISDQNQLMELQDCIQQSLDFPFTGLIFNQPLKFRSASVMKFFKNYGARFTSLRLDTWWTIRLQELVPFINHLPRLSILEAGPSYGAFPPTELLDSAAVQEDGRTLHLPSLRTLRISSQVKENVLAGVLAATSPSLRIECMSVTRGVLRALVSAGKLQAVSDMAVEKFYCEQNLWVDELLSNESPTLTKLDVAIDGLFSLEALKKILISSQLTLKELRLDGIRPSQFSSECPVLAKLTTLSLRIGDQPNDYIFQGINGHKFPALKKLKLVVMDRYENPPIGYLSDGLFIVPSLTMIDLSDGCVDNDGIIDLARSFPNVIEIRLNHKWYEMCTHCHPTDIWGVRAFQFLEKLTIWNYIIQPRTENYGNMDSFFTGIPIGICKNLRHHPKLDLVDSPFNKLLRSNPSILQLKNLKELVVCVSFEYGSDELPVEPPFMSMVSVWYALKMMPNLQAKFVYDYRSPSWCFKLEERDKAVSTLETAFKHVQPYVELEPFFY